MIARNIKKTRELAGLSQEQLAEMLGVSRATLSAIENGHVSIDSGKLLVAARVLGGRCQISFGKRRKRCHSSIERR